MTASSARQPVAEPKSERVPAAPIPLPVWVHLIKPVFLAAFTLSMWLLAKSMMTHHFMGNARYYARHSPTRPYVP